MRARLLSGVAALAVAGLLTGCSGASGPTSSPSTEPGAAPSATPSSAPAAPAEPSLAPDLPAAENQPYFDLVNQRVIAANGSAGGREFIDALVAAGFDKAAMQVTADRTAIDLAADSVQWSVLWNGACLIGQYGPASGGYHSLVAAPTAQGACLIGTTRPIDW